MSKKARSDRQHHPAARQAAHDSRPPSDRRPRATKGTKPRRTVGPLLRALAFPAILGAALVAVAVVALTAPGAPAGADPIRFPRPVLGSSSAVVEIHEYADFQCPSCGAFSRSIRPQIVEAYVDTGRARIVWHDFAWIGAESRAAANAARCAGDQGRFWEYHDLVYANQAGENQGAFSTANLKAFGAELGLEPVPFEACVDGGTYAAAVQADLADVRQLGLTGTPTFVIGTQRIVGAQRFEVFQAAIEAILRATSATQ